MTARLFGILTALVAVGGLLWLIPRKEKNVVVCYAALDQEFAEPLLKEFQRRTGIRVDMVYDSESTKTVGLVTRLVSEAARPRCDVFWNNEIIHTLQLRDRGIFATYAPAAAANFPAADRDPQRTWTAFAARVRILIVNTDLVNDTELPRRLADLLKNPKWRGRIGMANPQFGSTGTWLAALYTRAVTRKKSAAALASNPESRQASPQIAHDSLFGLLEQLVNQGYLRIVGGNKQVAQSVSSGALSMGFTDTDDALGEILSGKPVHIVFLDGSPNDAGVLVYPNTLAIIRHAPHPKNAKKLVDFLLRKEVEIALAKSRSGQIPLNPAITPGKDYTPRLAIPRNLKIMPVDWEKVDKNFAAATRQIEKSFER